MEYADHLEEQKAFLVDMVKHLCEQLVKVPPEYRDRIPQHRSECDCLCHQGQQIMHFEACCDRGPGDFSRVFVTERDVIEEQYVGTVED
jgi:hypothetical protein